MYAYICMYRCYVTKPVMPRCIWPICLANETLIYGIYELQTFGFLSYCWLVLLLRTLPLQLLATVCILLLDGATLGLNKMSHMDY